MNERVKKDPRFSTLVEELDKKWSHTYLDPEDQDAEFEIEQEPWISVFKNRQD